MNIIKHRCPALLLLAGLGFASTAQADLVAKLGGTVVYDTDRNLTWLANANANGPMTWDQANTWAASLNVADHTGWRLPTALNADGSGPCYEYNCTVSELGHLFYGELGGVAGQSITTTHNANFNLFNTIQSYVYWSDTEYAANPGAAWSFATNSGYQGLGSKDTVFLAWAVHTGDVAAVPEPEEYMMMLLGFTMVGWQIKRGQRKAAPAH
jgi:hypothetical protein